MSQDTQTQTVDPVAEFLARGGKIQSVEPGVRTMSEREVYAKASGSDEVETRVKAANRKLEEDDAYTERRMMDAENQVGLEQYHVYYRF